MKNFKLKIFSTWILGFCIYSLLALWLIWGIAHPITSAIKSNYERRLANAEIQYDDGYYEGYNIGYDEGYYRGYEDGNEDGISDGYDLGYEEGYYEGDDYISDIYDMGYEEAIQDYEEYLAYLEQNPNTNSSFKDWKEFMELQALKKLKR